MISIFKQKLQKELYFNYFFISSFLFHSFSFFRYFLCKFKKKMIHQKISL